MWRETRRVLKPGGCIAGYIIHTPPGLTPSDQHRAAELGPSYVLAEDEPASLARSAGLSITTRQDVTAAFQATCEAFLQAREAYEKSLRAEEGDDAFATKQKKEQNILSGIQAGLLHRTLIVGVREFQENNDPKTRYAI